MPDQASGTNLGMTLGELHRIRPGLIVDENGVWESVAPFRSNSYVFARSTLWENPRKPLQAVIVDHTVNPSDPAVVFQEVQVLYAKWAEVAGPQTGSLNFSIDKPATAEPIRKKLIYWCEPDALLLLIYDEKPPADWRTHSLVRAVIQTPGLELPVGFGIPYRQISCV